MSWRRINNGEVLERLHKQPLLGVRLVVLDPEPGACPTFSLTVDGQDATDRMIEAWKDIRAGRRYQLRMFQTDPAAVEVLDGESALGAYVWLGRGGPLETSRDDRVIQLVDALEAEYRGQPGPAEWIEPEPALCECGRATCYHPGGEADGVEVDLGGGVRASVDGLGDARLSDLVGRHCTADQQQQLARLIGRKRHELVDLVNVRIRGGGTIGQLLPIVRDRFGLSWIITPSGTLERVE